jgi:penicillin-binding protein 1A
MKVYTTLDSRLQGFAQVAVRAGLKDLDKRQGYRGPLELISAENFPEIIETLRVSNGLTETAAGVEGVEGVEGAEGVEEKLPWEKEQILKALVVKAGKDGVELDLGGVEGYLPLDEMKWARPPDTSIDFSEYVVKRADDVLKPGSLIMARFLGEMDKEKRALFALEQEPLVEGALVCMDAPTGQVLAMIGGYDYNRSEFNRATQAVRQPGSAFKPIVYSAAMDNGFTPSSIIVDSPIIYDDPSQELKWKPSNYSEKFYGPTPLRTGLVKSRNVITIKLVQKLGIQAVIQYAKRFGIKEELPEDLSISLGSMGITPIGLTSAYTVFANMGLRASPWFIMRVEDRNGEVLEEGGPELIRSLSEDTAFIMQNLLRGVVQSGTGWRARALGRPTGGKTGTTNDMIDAWYMGFTPKIVTGTWVGFDEDAPMGQNETGSRAAAPIWLSFMEKAMADRPVLPFPPPPPGIEMVKVDPDSGLLAGPGADRFIYEAFKIGTAPREYARSPNRPGGQFGTRSYTPGYVPPAEVPGMLPRDF